MPRSTLQSRTTLLLPSTVLARIKAIAQGENTALAEMIRRAIDQALTIISAADLATSALTPDQPTERFILYMPSYMEEMLQWKANQEDLTMHQYAAMACAYLCDCKEALYAHINNLNAQAA